MSNYDATDAIGLLHGTERALREKRILIVSVSDRTSTTDGRSLEDMLDELDHTDAIRTARHAVARAVEEFKLSAEYDWRDDGEAARMSREAGEERARREVIRMGMRATEAGYHRFGRAVKLARSSPPRRFAFYQGEF